MEFWKEQSLKEETDNLGAPAHMGKKEVSDLITGISMWTIIKQTTESLLAGKMSFFTPSQKYLKHHWSERNRVPL